MTIFPFCAVFPRVESVTPDEAFFLAIKEQYTQYQGKSIFEEFPQEALYIYQIDAAGRTHTGLVGCIPVQAYMEGRILRHEMTISAKEEVQLSLTLERGATVKPVLLTYSGITNLTHWLVAYTAITKPSWSVYFKEEEQEHRFYPVVHARDIHLIQEMFSAELDHAYIADGHHRFSSAVRLYEERKNQPDGLLYQHLMCALFPTEALDIHNFNRLITHAFKDISPTAFMARLSEVAEITPIPQAALPLEVHEMTMLLENEWYLVRWRDLTWFSRADKSVCTDVDLFNDLILHQILGIHDIRADERIEYVEGPKGLEGLQKAVSKEPGSVGFCLHPLSWESFLAIIDAGQVLPPKSTWFEPRMKNGLIVQKYT